MELGIIPRRCPGVDDFSRREHCPHNQIRRLFLAAQQGQQRLTMNAQKGKQI